MRKIGFDSEKYLREQSQYILERVAHYDKLYLEFGGKLFHDAHAGRVLPGYDPDVKISLLNDSRMRSKSSSVSMPGISSAIRSIRTWVSAMT